MSALSVWITGARGFIGRHLARQLAECGHEVCGLGHGLWAGAEARRSGIVRWRNGDVRIANLESLAREQPRPPEVIFHLAGGASVAAALAGPLEDFDRTVGSTAELLEWVRMDSPRSRVIAISSAAVYGAAGAAQLNEQTLCEPCSAYGFHKLMAEQLCRSYRETYGVRVSVVRLFSVYGPGLKKQLLWDLCTRLAAGERNVQLGGSGKELRDWTDVRDVASALAFLMTSDIKRTSVINIGTGAGTTVKRISDIVLACWPHAAEVTFSGKSRSGDPFSLVAESNLLSELGFRWTISLEHGIAGYVEWFLSQAKSAP
jgi:UDP-glucose 4-epimerase